MSKGQDGHHFRIPACTTGKKDVRMRSGVQSAEGLKGKYKNVKKRKDNYFAALLCFPRSSS